MAIWGDGALKEILRVFPRQCNYAFAYGSAVFPQKNQKPGKMIDLVFVVDDPLQWHKENMSLNPDHYSSLRYLGAKRIASLQERMACGVYYNPFCDVQDKIIKYGIISTQSLETDLQRWKHMYIAGRLHKPVVDLQPPSSPSLIKSLKKNRQTALQAVLLQEGLQMNTFTLYHGIAELSYLGDTRMRLAENPQKTKNIVTPLMKEFDKVYLPLLAELSGHVMMTPDGVIYQDTSPPARFKCLMALPVPLQISLAKQHFRDPRLNDIEDIMGELSYLPYLRLYIRNAISEVVRGSSILQTLQGVLTAGVVKSTKYAWEKLKKRTVKKPVVEPIPPSAPLTLPPPLELAQKSQTGDDAKKTPP